MEKKTRRIENWSINAFYKNIRFYFAQSTSATLKYVYSTVAFQINLNMSKKGILSKQSRGFFFISGASKGLGRNIAVSLAEASDDNSTFLLTARSDTGLEETKSRIKVASPNAKVWILTQDLSKPDKAEFENFVQDALKDEAGGLFDEAVLVHNAGSLGNHGTKFNEVF